MSMRSRQSYAERNATTQACPHDCTHTQARRHARTHTCTHARMSVGRCLVFVHWSQHQATRFLAAVLRRSALAPHKPCLAFWYYRHLTFHAQWSGLRTWPCTRLYIYLHGCVMSSENPNDAIVEHAELRFTPVDGPGLKNSSVSLSVAGRYPTLFVFQAKAIELVASQKRIACHCPQARLEL